MKVTIILALLLAVVTSLFLYNNKESHRQDSLKIGMMSGWAPFMVINKNGDFEGFDVDVAREIAQRLDKKCEITDLGSLSSLFVALDRNRIDVILSGLDITQERLSKINMISYCGEATKEYMLLFWGKIPDNINNIEDLKNYNSAVVVVEPGVSAEKYLDTLDFISKKQIASLVDRLLDLQYGKSLAMLLEPAMAKSLMAKNPELKALKVPLAPEFQIHGMGIAAKKDRAELRDQIQEALDAMKKDGTLKQIKAKWQFEDSDEKSDEV